MITKMPCSQKITPQLKALKSSIKFKNTFTKYIQHKLNVKQDKNLPQTNVYRVESFNFGLSIKLLVVLKFMDYLLGKILKGIDKSQDQSNVLLNVALGITF